MNIVDVIRSALRQLPQTNNPFDAYGQMVQNPNIPQPIRQVGQIAYNAPGVGLKQIGQNITQPQNLNEQALNMALMSGGVIPKMGPESINAMTQLTNKTIRRGNTSNPENYEMLLKTASEQIGLPLKTVLKMDVVSVARNLLATMQRRLEIPRLRPK